MLSQGRSETENPGKSQFKFFFFIFSNFKNFTLFTETITLRAVRYEHVYGIYTTVCFYCRRKMAF